MAVVEINDLVDRSKSSLQNPVSFIVPFLLKIWIAVTSVLRF